MILASVIAAPIRKNLAMFLRCMRESWIPNTPILDGKKGLYMLPVLFSRPPSPSHCFCNELIRDKRVRLAAHRYRNHHFAGAGRATPPLSHFPLFRRSLNVSSHISPQMNQTVQTMSVKPVSSSATSKYTQPYLETTLSPPGFSPAWKLNIPVENIAETNVAGRKNSVTTAMVFMERVSLLLMRL